MIRRLLDILYLTSGCIAAVFLVAIAVTIVVQILGRMVGVAIDATEISGFCLAATTFLGLAYTFHSGSHIRVNLLIRRFAGRQRRVLELWCCGASVVVIGYFTYHAIALVRQSHAFGDMSYSLVAIPMWIPQLGMAVGLAVFTLGLIDAFVTVARDQVPSYEAHGRGEIGEVSDEPAAGSAASLSCPTPRR